MDRKEFDSRINVLLENAEEKNTGGGSLRFAAYGALPRRFGLVRL